MTKEALKLALEALELNNDKWKSLADSGDAGYWRAEDQDHYKQTNKAITAIKEALAQPQRPWVGLTSEDRLSAKLQDTPNSIDAVIDYIEQALKEKNT